MPRIPLSDDIKEQIKVFYKKGFSNKMIANIVGVSEPSVLNVVRELARRGEVKAKKDILGKKRTPNGQGKGAYVKKGYNPVNKKLTEEQEKELLKDYFENGFTYKQVAEKYHLWQHSIKIIIDKAVARGEYESKRKRRTV